MKVHIGKIVTQLLREKGIKKSAFALSMNYSKQNINSLLLKDNWSVNQVWQASVILKHNLFENYSTDASLNHLESIRTPNEKRLIELEEQINQLQTENKLLNTLVEDKGKIIALLS